MSTETISRSPAPPAGHDVIVVGASAGSVEALAELARHLPAALSIVLHVPSYSISVLPRILGRRGARPAFYPTDGEEIRPGHIYVAPPDHHLRLKPSRVRLTRSPAENGHRPTVDTLFRSTARAYDPRV